MNTKKDLERLLNLNLDAIMATGGSWVSYYLYQLGNALIAMQYDDPVSEDCWKRMQSAIERHQQDDCLRVAS